ncbi:hypothetical protein AB5I41_10125 [Sphingomonas sp. MMS24-JH45]
MGEGIGGALSDSLRRTRGRGLPLTGALVALFVAQWIVAVPLLSEATGYASPPISTRRCWR